MSRIISSNPNGIVEEDLRAIDLLYTTGFHRQMAPIALRAARTCLSLFIDANHISVPEGVPLEALRAECEASSGAFGKVADKIRTLASAEELLALGRAPDHMEAAAIRMAAWDVWGALLEAMHIGSTGTRKMPEAELSARELYETDFVRWCQQQGEAVRAGRWDDVDRDNAGEELECLGKECQRSVEESLTKVIVLNIERQLDPCFESDGEDREEWLSKVGWFRTDIETHIETAPSLLDHLRLTLAAAYDDAVQEIRRKHGAEWLDLLEQCPWSADEIIKWHDCNDLPVRRVREDDVFSNDVPSYRLYAGANGEIHLVTPDGNDYCVSDYSGLRKEILRVCIKYLRRMAGPGLEYK